VYELLQDGTIPAKQFRRRWIISRNQFHAWLDSAPEHDH
jgi:excisionase family DNA binding protein